MLLPNKLLLRSVLLLSIYLLSSSFVYPPDTDFIALGDKSFDQMRYKEAVAYYLADSNTAEAQWKASRAYVCYADIVSASQSETYYRKAEKAARRSIQLDASNSNGHDWLAASLGNIALYEGSRTKVLLCNEIKSELDKALALNIKDDIAYSILGTFYRVLGDISWLERNLAMMFLGGIPEGGYEDSERCFNKAVQLAPLTMRHWYEMGLLYQLWDKDAKAKEAFLRAQKCPVKLASDKNRLQKINDYLSSN